MDAKVKVVECPRDAWLGLANAMPAELKADYQRALIAAGFRHIDAVSFGPRTAVPQMESSELVLEYLDLPGLDVSFNGDAPEGEMVEILGLVGEREGAERAAETGKVRALAFPYSISETFLKRAQAQTAEEMVDALEEVGGVAQKAGLDLVGYIGMAWGNPFGEPWSIDEVLTACELLVESGASTLSLVDTVGLATPEQIGELVGAVVAAEFRVEVGVHLHARPDGAAAKIRAAFEADCRRFDSAIGGIGGAPFAQDALVGNISTETLLMELGRLGAELPEISSLEALARAGAEMQRKYGGKIQ